MNFIRRYWRGVLICLFFSGTLGLGWYSIDAYFTAKNDPRSFWEVMYFVAGLFFLETGEMDGAVSWQLLAARWLGAAVAFSAVAGALLVVFRDRIREARLYLWRGHVIICGLGRKGVRLVEEFHNDRWHVATIECDANNPNIARCRESGAITLVGDASDPELLARAGAVHARYVFVVTGDDGTNVAAALKLHRLKQEHDRNSMIARAGRFLTRSAAVIMRKLGMKREWMPKSRITTCVVHLVDLHLCELFKQHSLFQDDTDRLEVRVFNNYENAARMLLADHPLEGETPAERRKTPHLMLLGFGKMGQSVALQAAKTGHYASGVPVNITVVDRDADRLGEVFMGRYGQFAQICNVEFMKTEIGSVQMIQQLKQYMDDPDRRITLAVCLDDDRESLAAGMLLATQLAGNPIPIHVRLAEATGLAALFEDGDCTRGWLQYMRPFAMICQTCRIHTVVEDRLDTLAKAIHQAYVESNKGKSDATSNPALQPWDRLAPTFRDSNRQQADHIPVKLRAIGCRTAKEDDPEIAIELFSEEELELIARMEHERWNAERFLGGWTLGERDSATRKNPCLVSWEDLPPDIQEFDKIFVRNIPTFLKEVNLKVVRTV